MSKQKEAIKPTRDIAFRTSSACNGGACVAVAVNAQNEVLVKDLKHSGGPVLAFTQDEWSAFVTGVKNDEFNLTSTQ